ncbi:hypothetical protein TKK_0016496 [Trichogramma kaykai]
MHGFTSILNGKSVFLTLDLYQAFNQIPLITEDIPKTALTQIRLFEFLFMPFGLCNASQTFQSYVKEALGDLDFLFVYIDDVLIASQSMEKHQSHLKTVLERLDRFNLRLNLDKCVFATSEVTFLSHLINAQGFSPPPDKRR